MPRPLLAVVATLFAALLPLAAAAAPAPATLDEARAALARVLAGDAADLERAGALFAALAEADPRDPLAAAYLAETLALRAWHAGERDSQDAGARAIAQAERALALPAGRAPAREEAQRAAAFAYLAVARRELLRAQLGDAAALPRADALFARTAELAPQDPLPAAYRGVLLALRASTAGEEGERAALVQGGLAALDRALALAEAPAGAAEASRAEARLLAAGVFIALPDEPFHRFARGLELLERELADPGLALLPPRLRAHLHYQASLAARRQGRGADEAAHLRAYAELAPRDDPFAAVVGARLAEVAP